MFLVQLPAIIYFFNFLKFSIIADSASFMWFLGIKSYSSKRPRNAKFIAKLGAKLKGKFL